MVRNREEIEAKLAEVEIELERIESDENYEPDHEDNQYLWEGWKEALEWVLTSKTE